MSVRVLEVARHHPERIELVSGQGDVGGDEAVGGSGISETSQVGPTVRDVTASRPPAGARPVDDAGDPAP